MLIIGHLYMPIWCRTSLVMIKLPMAASCCHWGELETLAAAACGQQHSWKASSTLYSMASHFPGQEQCAQHRGSILQISLSPMPPCTISAPAPDPGSDDQLPRLLVAAVLALLACHTDHHLAHSHLGPPSSPMHGDNLLSTIPDLLDRVLN